MQKYSDFFKTLHDETRPTGYLGRGTHYSVLRAVVFHDATGEPLPEAQFADFAVIWDEDHDIRVFEPIEEIYRRGLLSSFLMFGERKGFFTAVLSNKVRGKLFRQADERVAFLGTEIHGICQSLDDPWASGVLAPGSGHNPIIDDDDQRVALYLNNLETLWQLGTMANRPDVRPLEAGKMGMFENEQRKMAEEAAQRARSGEQQKTELSQIAQQVSEDLLGFIGRTPGGEDLDVGLLHNQITLRGRSSRKALEIACNGPDIFRLKGDIIAFRNKGFQTQVTEPRRSADDSGTISKSEMLRMVIAWVRERRAA